jgi:protein gp37
MAATGIEWTDLTWNPIGGCSVHSPGCIHCYAQTLAGGRLKSHPLYAGTTTPAKTGPVFNGHLTVAPDDHRVWLKPLRWRGAKHPRRGPGARSLIFVGDMSDLFHEDRPDAHIDRVFAVMALCPQHDFQVLTKRADRMREYVSSPSTPRRVYELVCDLVTVDQIADVILIAPGIDPSLAPPGKQIFLGRWPLPNVWCGVSVEDQRRADERIPEVLATPAAVRFISYEPAIGPVDLAAMPFPDGDARHRWDALTGQALLYGDGVRGHPDVTIRMDKPLKSSLDWIICGGESGPKARPMHPDWARSLRDQCATAGVAFFFKQWGGTNKKKTGRRLNGRTWEEFPGGGRANEARECV